MDKPRLFVTVAEGLFKINPKAIEYMVETDCQIDDFFQEREILPEERMTIMGLVGLGKLKLLEERIREVERSLDEHMRPFVRRVKSDESLTGELCTQCGSWCDVVTQTGKEYGENSATSFLCDECIQRLYDFMKRNHPKKNCGTCKFFNSDDTTLLMKRECSNPHVGVSLLQREDELENGDHASSDVKVGREFCCKHYKEKDESD